MKDTVGFERFVRERGPGLLRLAWLLTADRDAAQDLVQESLARVVPKWDRISEAGNPDAYVRRALRNVWIDVWRRQRLTVVTDEVPDRPYQDAAIDGMPDHIAAAVVLASLAPGQRAVIVLRFFEDLTETQTARALGCSTSTVKSQTRDALAHLRALTPQLLVQSETVPAIKVNLPLEPWTLTSPQVAR